MAFISRAGIFYFEGIILLALSCADLGLGSDEFKAVGDPCHIEPKGKGGWRRHCLDRRALRNVHCHVVLPKELMP